MWESFLIYDILANNVILHKDFLIDFISTEIYTFRDQNL
jgi:hypothetical protein